MRCNRSKNRDTLKCFMRNENDLFFTTVKSMCDAFTMLIVKSNLLNGKKYSNLADLSFFGKS